MPRWQNEIDFSEADSDALAEYSALESEIEDFIYSHPENSRTEEDKEYLSSLVRQRPAIMRKLGKLKTK